jgi:hypothetical protein
VGEAFDRLQALNTGPVIPFGDSRQFSQEPRSQFTTCAVASRVGLRSAPTRRGMSECLQVFAHRHRPCAIALLTEFLRVRLCNIPSNPYAIDPLSLCSAAVDS